MSVLVQVSTADTAVWIGGTKRRPREHNSIHWYQNISSTFGQCSLSLNYMYFHGTGCTGSSGCLYSSLRLLVPQIEYDSLSLCILLQCTPPLYYSVLQCTSPLYYSVHLHCTTVYTSIVLQCTPPLYNFIEM